MNLELLYGVAYYPELWDKEKISSDIEHMHELGINVARMGEFSWSTMEPEEGLINLDFFINTIKTLNNNHIKTVFCIPTPTPPIWVTHNHPERLHVNSDNVRMSHGARQHICTNNQYFRQRSRIISEEIARQISPLNGVIAWQIDNELKGHVSECHCETCCKLWHEWLESRYGSIAVLNETWGNAIWSQEYLDFNQVPVPLPTPFAHNPALSTAYKRFHREKVTEFQNELAAIIRQYSDAPITHNSSMKHYVDNELLFSELDFASFDDYHDCDNPQGMLMDYDLWRNIKPGKSFWVMETSPGNSGCILGYRRAHRPGYLTAESIAAYALGAEAFCYWQWRQHRAGVEMPHGAILTAWGAPSAGYKDVMDAGKEIKKIAPLITGSKPVQGKIAIVYSDIARAYLLTEPLEGPDYLQLMSDWYRIVLATGYHRDLIYEGHFLDDYQVVMTPFLPHIREDFIDRVENFVINGGTWIVGPLSGHRTLEHTANTDAALGQRLENLAGIKTAFMFSPTHSEETGEAFGASVPLSLWSSFYDLESAISIGKVVNGVGKGKHFITENQVGKGKVVLIGSMPSGDEGKVVLHKLISRYAGGCDHFEVSEGTYAAPRVDNTGKIVFVINMDGQGGWINLPSGGSDALNEGVILEPGRLNIEAHGYRAIRTN